MSFSEKDGIITITAHTTGGLRKVQVLSHKDAAFDPGDAAAQQVGGGEVVFISEGARKPKLSFSIVNGVEGGRIRDVCLDPDGKCWPLTVTHAFRRHGVGSLSFTFEDSKLGKGGGYKASDGAGLEGDAFEILATKVTKSVNGGRPRRTA